MMKIISIIPAKERSRGLPGKNVKLLHGHPLLAYSIEASVLSEKVIRTICSTDSSKVAEIAKKYGAEVPYLRPSNLAGDHTTDLEVFVDIIDWLKQNENYEPDIIVHLRPTTPIRKKGWTDKAIQLLLDNPEADSVRCVCEAPIHPCKMWKIENPYMTPLLTIQDIPEAYNMPRQKLPKYYWQTAVIDVIRGKTIIEKKSMTGKNILPFVMPLDLAVDIDNIRDFNMAELVMNDEPDLVKPLE